MSSDTGTGAQSVDEKSKFSRDIKRRLLLRYVVSRSNTTSTQKSAFMSCVTTLFHLSSASPFAGASVLPPRIHPSGRTSSSAGNIGPRTMHFRQHGKQIRVR